MTSLIFLSSLLQVVNMFFQSCWQFETSSKKILSVCWLAYSLQAVTCYVSIRSTFIQSSDIPFVTFQVSLRNVGWLGI